MRKRAIYESLEKRGKENVRIRLKFCRGACLKAALDMRCVLFTADVHRSEGKRFNVSADKKLPAFFELERQVWKGVKG